MKVKQEIHLFVIWNNAYSVKDEFLLEINKILEVIGVHELTWSDDAFDNNLMRFYRKRPSMSDKGDRVGRKPFTLIVVKDNNPLYETRHTSKGDEVVNVNIFDLKDKFRKLSGPPDDLIHATNNLTESNHDLTLLLGLNCDDYLKTTWITKIPDKINRNLMGYNGWNNITDMFYVLNNTIEYVVLRNWEGLPDKFLLDGHNDIDLLVDNLKDAIYILNAEKVFPEDHRVHFKVKIDNDMIPFDLRFVGDDYYDIKFEKDILNDRIINNGFYVPNDYFHFYSLLYHAFVHKHNIKDDYKVKLNSMTENYKPEEFTQNNAAIILREFLNNHDYKVTRPEPSVRYNSVGVDLIYG